ncbi:MAG: M13 family metallopeptidase, partial [Myxococcales bacterium]|nr:M13 family metallopeptidase [Myxococcales bacterium]
MRASPDRVLLCMLILGACSPKPTVAPEQPTPADETSNQPAAPATDALAAMRAAIDERVDPCQDFYQYACGAWIERAEIPADRPLTTMTMGILDDTEAHLKDMLEQAAARPADDDRERKLGDYYAACMDEAAIDAAGARPLAPALAKIATVKSLQSALEVAAELSAWGPELFYAVDIGPDAKDPKTNLLHVSQGGLGLPSREFYLRADEDSKKVLRAYEAHVAAMLRIAGDAPDDAARWAAQIVALETVLAEGSAPLDQLRDTEKTYNKMGVKALNKLTPGIKWRPVLERGGLGHVEAINVQTPSYFTAMAKHLRTRDAGLLRAAMRFHLVAQLAPQLAREIDQQAFAFTSTLTGQREQRARWSRCVNDTSAALPELVGFYYVERAFAGESKRVATEMIVAVEKAFEAGLDALPWMDDETRARARAKAAKLVNKVGYPDRWRDYSAVQVVRDDYFASFRSARALDAARERAKAGQPVDPDEWHMAPFMLNAYANPTGLEMVFPAGILQPP